MPAGAPHVLTFAAACDPLCVVPQTGFGVFLAGFYVQCYNTHRTRQILHPSLKLNLVTAGYSKDLSGNVEMVLGASLGSQR